MTRITIATETETDHGWRYQVRVNAAGRRRDFEVALSWAEHDLWSRGRVPPHHVVRAAFAFLLDRQPLDAIVARFDCAVIRRHFPEVDRVLPGLIQTHVPPDPAGSSPA